MAKQTFTTGQVLTAAQMTSLQQTAMGGGSTTAKTTSYVLVAADAGTTVQMNAAGATTITVNTALFAAGDVVFIQNIGAGICTITAGTATVTTAGSLALGQWEGGQLFFNSTSASVFFDYVQTGATSPLTTKGDVWGYSTLDARIPIGTNNQVLTADSAQALGLKWATPTAAAASYSLLNAGGTALTGAATITVSGISGMNKLLILMTGASTTSGTSSIYFRLNADTGANYGGTRTNIEVTTTYSPAAGYWSSSNSLVDTFVYIAGQGPNAADTCNAQVLIDGCNSAGHKIYQYNGGGNATNATASAGPIWYWGGGRYTGTSTISSVSLISGANFDAGTLYIYGSA